MTKPLIERVADCLEELIAVAEEDCRLDHHGYCQAHYLDKVDEGGCRVANARELLAEIQKEQP